MKLEGSIHYLLDACIAYACIYPWTFRFSCSDKKNSLFCPCGDLFTVPVFLYSFPLKAALASAAHRDATNPDKRINQN